MKTEYRTIVVVVVILAAIFSICIEATSVLIKRAKQEKRRTSGFLVQIGDLEESRTPIDGMKTRCTNRYTTRP